MLPTMLALMFKSWLVRLKMTNSPLAEVRFEPPGPEARFMPPPELAELNVP